MPIAPIRAIVGRFSFDFSKKSLERVFQKRHFAFCGILSTGDPSFFQGVSADAQEWFSSSEIRNCQYANIDWHTLTPIDAVLLEKMRECETTFMATVARLEWKRTISYTTRKLWYLRHLQFWNDYLTRRKINLYLSAWIPHEIPDIIIYHLCKHRGIPVLYFHNTTVRDYSTAEHDIALSAQNVGDRYQELLAKHPPGTAPESVILQGSLAEYHDALVVMDGDKPPLEHFHYKTYWDKVRGMLLEQPLSFIKFLLGYCSPSGIVRAAKTMYRSAVIRKTHAFYDEHAIAPDLNCPFIYCPLHYQPEASTVPMGGSYQDQILVARMLNAVLPDDVLIYIKEHPRDSGWLTRSPEYYREFLELKKVRFIRKDADTFALREHCRAVATISGSAGFEALFRGKPVLLFGHRFFQYAHGVHRVRSLEDCKNAVRSIFEKKERPTLLDVRLYLKAMEEKGIHGLLDPWNMKVSHLSKEEHVRAVSTAIIDALTKIG